MNDLRPRSRFVTDSVEATASRGILHAVGMDDDDWDKAQIGIASSWNEITHFDGISVGPEGIYFAWLSREVIADTVEAFMQAEHMGGSLCLAGCDSSNPECYQRPPCSSSHRSSLAGAIAACWV